MIEKKDALKRVAVAAHPEVADAFEEATQIAGFLNENGLEAESTFLNDSGLKERVEEKRDVDLVITLGGDGTVLRAGHLCAPYDVPILAINQGRFGFLSEVASETWRDALPGLFSGEYWFEQRMMLRTEQWRGEELLGTWEVLNEAMLGRGQIVRPVHLVTHLDGGYLTTYVADGLIVSTATGSTAYALAVGGPILPPELRNILLIPVAPHLSVDRAIVLAEGSSVSVTMRTGHQAVLSPDGQPPIELEDGDRVDVRASEHSVRLLRFQDPEYFYQRILSFMDHNPSAGDAK
jgi:NAD+ kinase